MLRCWRGDVGERVGSGIWRTEWGVGIGSVETDMPLSAGPGRFKGEEVLGVVEGGCGCFSACLALTFLLATVCRIVSCGVLEVREAGGGLGEAGEDDITTGLLLGFRCDETCHGETVGAAAGAGSGASVLVPSC